MIANNKSLKRGGEVNETRDENLKSGRAKAFVCHHALGQAVAITVAYREQAL